MASSVVMEDNKVLPRNTNPALVTTQADDRAYDRKSAPPQKSNMFLLGVLWGLTFLLFGFADAITTTLAIKIGASESNAVMSTIIHAAQGNPWILTLIKIFILAILLVWTGMRNGKYLWIVPAILACAGAYLTAQNLVMILALH